MNLAPGESNEGESIDTDDIDGKPDIISTE